MKSRQILPAFFFGGCLREYENFARDWNCAFKCHRIDFSNIRLLGSGCTVYDFAVRTDKQLPLPAHEGTGHAPGSQVDAWHEHYFWHPVLCRLGDYFSIEMKNSTISFTGIVLLLYIRTFLSFALQVVYPTGSSKLGDHVLLYDSMFPLLMCLYSFIRKKHKTYGGRFEHEWFAISSYEDRVAIFKIFNGAG